VTESFLNSLKASKSKKVEVEPDEGRPVVESDEPFFSPLILPTVDRLVYLGSMWEKLTTDLNHMMKNESEYTEEVRDGFRQVFLIMSDIEREYEV